MTSLHDEVHEHLWTLFPSHCLVLTDPLCRRAIDLSITRAGHHGFVRATEVRPFATMMLMLGSHFDEDPMLAWAGYHLRSNARIPRRQAMIDLLATMSQTLEPLVGEHGEYYQRALAWIGARSFDALVGTYGQDDESLQTFTRHLYRRKHDALGPAGVAQAVYWAHAMARHHGLTTPSGSVVMLGLMFLLGSSIDRDPFHPWVQQSLAASAGLDPDSRARQLHAHAQQTLARYTRLDAVSGGTPRS